MNVGRAIKSDRARKVQSAPLRPATHTPVHIGDSPVEKPESGPRACFQAEGFGRRT
jgi:hypothetical protein